MIGYFSMLKRMLLSILFLSIICPTCSAQDIVLRIGARQTINLEENPSTGYQWIINSTSVSQHNIIVIHDLGFKKNNTMPGSPGVHKWRIIAKKAGSLVLQFIYKRAWETEVVKDIKINILVH